MQTKLTLSQSAERDLTYALRMGFWCALANVQNGEVEAIQAMAVTHAYMRCPESAIRVTYSLNHSGWVFEIEPKL